MAAPRYFFFLVPHAQDKQIVVLEIVARDGIAIREHFAVVRQDESPSGQCTARHRDDTVAQRRYKQIQWQFRDRHNRTIHLPLGLAGVRRQLNLE